MEAIVAILERLIEGSITILRRDAPTFASKRRILREVVSSRVNLQRKRALLRRHHSLIPRILRERYTVQTVAHEMSSIRRRAEE